MSEPTPEPVGDEITVRRGGVVIWQGTLTPTGDATDVVAVLGEPTEAAPRKWTVWIKETS